MSIIGYIGIGIVSLILLELFVSHRKKFKTYTLSDSLVNLSCGMLERLFYVFMSVLYLIAFQFIYENISIWHIPVNAYTWVIALFVADMIAYWFHRLSHEINFLWAAHIVHHQSEELNITTVFRVSFFAVIFRFFFFMWMPVIGFDPMQAVACTIIIGLFQFVTHSRLVGKLGVFEWFFTTPSHHRVHHARNDKYIDRNYSHVFIIWDRIFGTFTEEQEEPDYGITSGFESVNPYRAQFSYWGNLFKRASRTKSLKNKIKLFFEKPTWTPEDSPFLPDEFSTDSSGERKLYRHIIKPELGAYVMLSVLSTFAAFLTVILIKANMQDYSLIDLVINKEIMVLVGVVLYSIFAHTRMMENAHKGFAFELLRILILAVSIIYLFKDIEQANVLTAGVAGFSIALVLWLFRLNAKKEEMSFQE